MKKHSAIASVALIAALPALAGPEQVASPIQTSPDVTNGWEWGFNANVIVGAESKFSGIGRWVSPNAVPPATGTVDRVYDDGFNRVDDTGNAGNLTSYWGYQNAAQYDPAGSGSISMSIYRSLQTGSTEDDDVGFGGEIFGYKRLGEVPLGSSLTAIWGIRLGAHVNTFSFENQGTLASLVSATTDEYDLGGAVPPAPPFSGSPTGFGNAVLSDIPVRTTSFAANGLTNGSWELDATLIGFSVAPYLAIPVGDKFVARLEGGACLALAFGDYDLAEATTIAPVGTQRYQAGADKTTLLPGAFLGLSGNYALTPHWGLDGGVRYQYYDSFEVKAGGSKAEIDFSGAFMIHFGSTYRF